MIIKNMKRAIIILLFFFLVSCTSNNTNDSNNTSDFNETCPFSKEELALEEYDPNNGSYCHYDFLRRNIRENNTISNEKKSFISLNGLELLLKVYGDYITEEYSYYLNEIPYEGCYRFIPNVYFDYGTDGFNIDCKSADIHFHSYGQENISTENLTYDISMSYASNWLSYRVEFCYIDECLFFLEVDSPIINDEQLVASYTYFEYTGIEAVIHTAMDMMEIIN